MLVEQRLQQMGIVLPDYARTPYPGSSDGTMKAHHIVGNLLFLGGHVRTSRTARYSTPVELARHSASRMAIRPHVSPP